MIAAVAFIVWIVYVTDLNVHRKPLNTSTYLHQTAEVVVVTPSNPKQSDTATIFTNINDAIEKVGLVCCLTTMLFFAAPLSNLVSIKVQ